MAAPERQPPMLQVRRAWAEREGLSADVIEEVYRRLVAYFIEREMEEWRETSRLIASFLFCAWPHPPLVAAHVFDASAAIAIGLVLHRHHGSGAGRRSPSLIGGVRVRHIDV